MGGKFTTKEKDLGFKKIIKELKKLEASPFVKVGWPVEAPKATAPHAKSEAFTVAMIAIVHEFGSPSAGIPERSMVRAAHDEKEKDWRKFTDAQVVLIYKGKLTVEKALDRIGLLMVSDIKNRILSGIPPKLVSREGVALVDTAQMLNALTFKRIMKK